MGRLARKQYVCLFVFIPMRLPARRLRVVHRRASCTCKKQNA